MLELTYTAQDMTPFARDMGHVDANGEVLRPFVWDEERRLKLRAKLDALYFILYGVFDPLDPAQITIAAHQEAGPLKERDAKPNDLDPFKYSSPTAGGLKKMRARQVRIDELGRIFDPGPR